MAKITSLDVLDIRFPTSRELDGSDAMNPDPDYSAAYVVLRTDEGPEGPPRGRATYGINACRTFRRRACGAGASLDSPTMFA